MDEGVFKQQLDYYFDLGLQLNPSAKRCDVGGYYGMVATRPIAKGEVLASFPVSKLLPLQPELSQRNDIPMDIRYICSASGEFQQGDSSDFAMMFAQFESLEQLKSCSTYFYSQDDLALLKRANLILFNKVAELNAATNYRLQQVKQIAPTLEDDNILTVALNHYSRAWGELGFLPVVDMFNHSDTEGSPVEIVADDASLIANKDYREGDELFMSYGRKDMNLHAIGFNYFDPKGAHFINYGSRFVQVAKTAFEKQCFLFSASNHPLKHYEKQGNIYYRIANSEAVFTEDQPSDQLLGYLKDNCFGNVQELQAGRSSKAALKHRLLQSLEILLDVNKVESFKESDFPPNVRRFYHLLVKERQMLAANKQWVEQHFA